MRHLTFYYAIGFAVVGCIMLYTCLPTFIGMRAYDDDPLAPVALAAAMSLPFMIAALSWRDWREIQTKSEGSLETAKPQTRVLWRGKPFILPGVLVRSTLFVLVAAGMSWLEFSYGLAYRNILDLPVILWTALVILPAWALSLTRLLSLRASNTYVLRNDGLEITVGILASKSSVIAPSGFSDLEVTRSFSARITGSGDIIVRTQGERDIRMQKVRNPLKVADQIREVMTRPLVRVDWQEPVAERSRGKLEQT